MTEDSYLSKRLEKLEQIEKKLAESRDNLGRRSLSPFPARPGELADELFKVTASVCSAVNLIKELMAPSYRFSLRENGQMRQIMDVDAATGIRFMPFVNKTLGMQGFRIEGRFGDEWILLDSEDTEGPDLDPSPEFWNKFVELEARWTASRTATPTLKSTLED